MMNKEERMKKLTLLIVVPMVILMICPALIAATEAEIEQAIVDGLAWLASTQEGDGSWPAYYEDVATTGLAVLKFEHRAIELGYDSPFDTAYVYHQNVIDGLDYLFDQTQSQLKTVNLSVQDHTGSATGTMDDPDFNGNGIGVYAHGSSYPFDIYDTGIVLAAIAQSGTPTRLVNVPGSLVDGMQFIDVAQDMVDYLAWGQSDYDYGAIGMGEGGWTYAALNNDDQDGYYGPDNSNSGYAVLGLAYARAFGCTVPQWVETMLDAYIVDIQDPVDGDANGYDGGSWYDAVSGGSGIRPNILKTGNLIMEMALVGDDGATPRVVDALDYLARHWNDGSAANWPPGWNGSPAQYQTMFTTMKGLEYMAVDMFSGIDWYQDFADTIVAQQYKMAGPNYGSWQYSSGRGNPTIITAWALLTLEKTAPPPPFKTVFFDIKPTSCPNPLNVKPFTDNFRPGEDNNSDIVSKKTPGAKQPNAVLPVAILGEMDFDVATIDVATVELNGLSPIRWAYEDVATPVGEDAEECECNELGPDGYMDLTLKFSKAELVATLGDVYDGDLIPLTITGILVDGTEFEGTDCVLIRAEVAHYMANDGDVDQFDLEGNFPNPFNPSTEICFSLPQAEHVRLDVFNILGERIATLVDEVIQAGRHTVTWDGTNDYGTPVASGVYFYRIQAGDYAASRKMIMMK
jgi:hypothetical protein